MAKFWKNNKGIIVFLFLMLFFRSAIADWYHVPTGSMKPNILIGDRVWVNKLAYDVKVPFTDYNLNRHHEPVRGDVVVFQSKSADERLIKRVIGVPGDKIAMLNNRLKINGEWVSIERIEKGQSFDEFLVDRDEADYLHESVEEDEKSASGYPIRVSRIRLNPKSSFGPIEVPDEQYLVLGDNRDNSQDSRWIGFVPRAELIGRAERVIISFDTDNYYLPRSGRYWSEL